MKLTRKAKVWACQQSHPCPSPSPFNKKTFFSRIPSGNSSWQQDAASLAKGAALRWWHRSRRTTLQSYLQKRSEPPAMLRLITMLQHRSAPGFGKKWMLLVLYALTRLSNSPMRRGHKNTAFMEGDRFTVPRGFTKPQNKNGSSKAATHSCTTQNRNLSRDLRGLAATPSNIRAVCRGIGTAGLQRLTGGWQPRFLSLGSLVQFPSCSWGFYEPVCLHSFLPSIRSSPTYHHRAGAGP